MNNVLQTNNGYLNPSVYLNSSSGGVESVEAGPGVSVNNDDPSNPVVSVGQDFALVGSVGLNTSLEIISLTSGLLDYGTFELIPFTSISLAAINLLIDLTTNRITTEVSGRYLINLNLNCLLESPMTDPTDYLGAQIYKNGNLVPDQIIQSSELNPNNTPKSFSGSFLVDLEIGDYLEIKLGLSASASITTNVVVTGQINVSSFPNVKKSIFSGLEIGGRSYKTKVIGNLEWMVENLAYETGDFNYPGGDIGNTIEWGLLYNYQTAIDNTPIGWRIPTISDFDLLTIEAGGTLIAGKNLKLDDSIQWTSTVNRGDNSLGWGGQSAGVKYASFLEFGTGGYYWSSDIISVSANKIIFLDNSNSTVGGGSAFKANHLSVRYVRDA